MTLKGSPGIQAAAHLRLRRFHGRVPVIAGLGCAAVLLPWLVSSRAWADQVEMQTGDRYFGNVLSLSSNILVLQNEVLGTMRLPRDKVSLITFGSAPFAATAPLPSPAGSKPRTPPAPQASAAADSSLALRQLGAHTNLIRQVQKQFLTDAGPEANKKFDDLLSGLMSGKLTVDDLRTEARSAADQFRALKRDSGDDSGFAADAYLAILDQFLKGATPATSATNAPTPSSAPKPRPAAQQE